MKLFLAALVCFFALFAVAMADEKEVQTVQTVQAVQVVASTVAVRTRPRFCSSYPPLTCLSSPSRKRPFSLKPRPTSSLA